MNQQPSYELCELEQRNVKRQCKRPGRDIGTPSLMRELHKRKMMGKFFRNLEPGYAGSYSPPKSQGAK